MRQHGGSGAGVAATLPDGCLVAVFCYLDLTARHRAVLLVCRRWRRLVASRELVRCLELHTSRSSPGRLRELGLRAAHLPLHLSGRWASQLAGGLRTLDLCLLEQRGQHEVPLTVSAPLARFTALHSLRLAAYAVRWDPEARLPTCLTRLALGMAGDASGESAGFALGSLPHLTEDSYIAGVAWCSKRS
ncbi:hypothetical protein CHLNCDRAFT_134894 [Chlorella variabilis]|uniref:F-box domain-containing protein n=1 Tax=Chlorella variabilis TaxID=554065 RepID=E1ZH21_CHLVA|nr:hypothetical protein CHLNCDRAFT_134894 [Chlorella variabilis]EFN54849.1 hypothetical protein CHLNCDRAFT_134894 [Chlorella variabilis]|eukprot:XP_005846951.1 hypothetical protein CHLNCDRAFT_134894 [Chlorella variabilis]